MSISRENLFFRICEKQRHRSAAWLADQRLCFHYLECTISLLINPGARCLSGRAIRLRNERSGVRNLPPPCCFLEQDTLLPESIGTTKEEVAPSRHD